MMGDGGGGSHARGGDWGELGWLLLVGGRVVVGRLGLETKASSFGFPGRASQAGSEPIFMPPGYRTLFSV